ncbi:hypothetical protein QBC43DRAFT_362617 [Cladorrhinum sp. PSN259]|nr:hypothetical protein QBC43DRAFT_362617 [Cladorrhinum sp. PSN259]
MLKDLGTAASALGLSYVPWYLLAWIPGGSLLVTPYAIYLAYAFAHTFWTSANLPTETPYSYYGVDAYSSTEEINAAAHKVLGPLFPGDDPHKQSSWFSRSDSTDELAKAYNYFEILTNPYFRCEYHRQTGLPDWYGVPDLAICQGEKSINKIKNGKDGVWAGSWKLPLPIPKLAKKLPGPLAAVWGGFGSLANLVLGIKDVTERGDEGIIYPFVKDTAGTVRDYVKEAGSYSEGKIADAAEWVREESPSLEGTESSLENKFEWASEKAGEAWKGVTKEVPEKVEGKVQSWWEWLNDESTWPPPDLDEVIEEKLHFAKAAVKEKAESAKAAIKETVKENISAASQAASALKDHDIPASAWRSSRVHRETERQKRERTFRNPITAITGSISSAASLVTTGVTGIYTGVTSTALATHRALRSGPRGVADSVYTNIWKGIIWPDFPDE